MDRVIDDLDLWNTRRDTKKQHDLNDAEPLTSSHAVQQTQQ